MRLCLMMATLAIASLAACGPATALAQSSSDLFVAATEPIAAPSILVLDDAAMPVSMDVHLTENVYEVASPLRLSQPASIDGGAIASVAARPGASPDRGRALPTPLAGPPRPLGHTGGKGAETR